MDQLPIPIEKIYSSHYEDSLDLYRSINQEGIIIACNKAYAENLGYSKEEVLGKSIFDHVARNKFNLLKDSFEMWKKTGVVKNIGITMERNDGTQFPVLLNATNLYDDFGNLVGSNTVLRDISDLHLAKKVIGVLKEERVETVGQLASRIAHDIKNPITGIKNAAELMRMQTSNIDKTHSHYLDIIERQCNNLSRIADEITDFVKPKPIIRERSSILNIFQIVLAEINVPNEIKIIFPDTDATIRCDPFKIEIMFANLISNAIQVMNNDGQINLRIKKIDKSIVIEVEDNGPGIPNDKLSKIFDPFFTTRKTGTGLGLVSCKNITEQHGGSIDVESKIGQGTKFIINLPH